MGADVDDGVRFEDVADPTVLGKVVVGRRQHWIVDDGIRSGLEVSAWGLNRQQNIAVDVAGEGELVVVDEERAWVRSPVAVHGLADRFGKCPVPRS